MSDEISDFQKLIYNTYLKQLSINLNRPYRKREFFGDLEDDKKLALAKLELFFNRNPEINIDLYFKSGFMDNKNSFISINSFNDFSIVKKYTKLIKEKYNKDVEDDNIVSDFKAGLSFIIQYLKENNLHINQYIEQTNNSGVKMCFKHLKEQRISLYHLHALNLNITRDYPNEILNLYLDNFREKFYATQLKYKNSHKIKEIGDKIITKLKQIKQ